MSIKRFVRPFVILLMAFGFSQVISAAQLVTPPIPGPSGMPTQSWFMASTNDLAKDLAEANKQGKILAIVWEQRGCYYCKQMHEVNFQDHEVVRYVRGRFVFVRRNIHGNRAVMDMDGRAATEALLASKNRVTGTPTIQFLDRNGKEGFRTPGFAKPPLFLTVFEYVAEKAYESLTLRAYIVAKISEAKAKEEFKKTN